MTQAFWNLLISALATQARSRIVSHDKRGSRLYRSAVMVRELQYLAHGLISEPFGDRRNTGVTSAIAQHWTPTKSLNVSMSRELRAVRAEWSVVLHVLGVHVLVSPVASDDEGTDDAENTPADVLEQARLNYTNAVKSARESGVTVTAQTEASVLACIIGEVASAA